MSRPTGQFVPCRFPNAGVAREGSATVSWRRRSFASLAPLSIKPFSAGYFGDVMDVESDKATKSAVATPLPSRLSLIAMSALLIWHTAAMIVGPSPKSTITDAARVVLDPYMTLLRMDNVWGFFAPNVNAGSHFSYEIEDSQGKTITFTPAEALSRFHPNSIWMTDHYQRVLEEPDVYGDVMGAELCLKHASLNPVKVRLFQRAQKEFWPENQLDGEHPFSSGFVTEKTARTVNCPGR